MNSHSTARSQRRQFMLLSIFIAVLLGVSAFLTYRVVSLESQNSQYRASLVARQAEIDTYTRLTCATASTIRTSQTNTTYEAVVDGRIRGYRVHTPTHYDSNVRLPVVLSFDGIDGSGAQMQSYSGLDQLPAIVVYPDSLPSQEGFTAWQGAPYSQPGVDDIAFVRTVLKEVAAHYCTDPTRVYAVGMSNGGAFASLVGCELGDSIRAIASVSGAYYTSCQSKTRSPSLLVLHSIDDNRVPFGGELARGLPKVPDWVYEQAGFHGCKEAYPTKSENGIGQYGWYDCKDNAKVTLVTLGGQVHGWLSMPQATSAQPESTAQYIWQFFESTAPL